jgi:hypothetical protein
MAGGDAAIRANRGMRGLPAAILEAEMDAILTVAPPSFCRPPLCVDALHPLRAFAHPLSLCPPSVTAVARIAHSPVAALGGAAGEPASPSRGRAGVGLARTFRGAVPPACPSARAPPHCCAMPRCLRLDAGFGPLFGMHALRFSVLPPTSGRSFRCGRNHGLSGRMFRGQEMGARRP